MMLMFVMKFMMMMMMMMMTMQYSPDYPTSGYPTSFCPMWPVVRTPHWTDRFEIFQSRYTRFQVFSSVQLRLCVPDCRVPIAHWRDANIPETPRQSINQSIHCAEDWMTRPVTFRAAVSLYTVICLNICMHFSNILVVSSLGVLSQWLCVCAVVLS